MKARDIAIAGILIALQVLTLLLVFVLPTIKLALLFAACVYPGILLRLGVKKSVILTSFVACATLVFLIVQIPEIQFAYVAFFGWYGLVHENTRNISMAKQQLIRWGCFSVSVGFLYTVFTYIITFQLEYALWLIALLGAVSFIVMQVFYELIIKEFIKISKIKLIDGKIVFK